ncbi:hypothetical protein GGR88_001490 [Sphingomonas jejuensis]|uniref:Ice-binding protein C-terminal domain-containing protein n=1 Tax=Sphingomonas jejuensis TaxID=904715 RepID=A0ABX0XKX5_9SPHN|nr:PEPxxWA-CTERM sorting domain-containing protein [Sphingomonas jejuensis]NJC34016.1 hypothetical protein [Sphingomonas jejuensis]
MRNIILAGALALGAATSANAAVVYPVGTPGALGLGQQLINDFNTAGAQAQVTGGGFIFQSGSNSNGGAIFGGDGTTYLSVLTNGSANVSTLSLGQGTGIVYLDIGSVDTYNTITLNFVGGGSQSFTGSQIANPANGSQSSPILNARFAFNGQGQLIQSISFASSQNSLEVDNIAVSVPEPATWGMMIAGFGIVGASLRRRRQTVVTA